MYTNSSTLASFAVVVVAGVQAAGLGQYDFGDLPQNDIAKGYDAGWAPP